MSSGTNSATTAIKRHHEEERVCLRIVASSCGLSVWPFCRLTWVRRQHNRLCHSRHHECSPDHLGTRHEAGTTAIVVGAKSRPGRPGREERTVRPVPATVVSPSQNPSAQNAEPVIAASNVVKRYGQTVAVDRLDLSIWPGEIF